MLRFDIWWTWKDSLEGKGKVYNTYIHCGIYKKAANLKCYTWEINSAPSYQKCLFQGALWWLMQGDDNAYDGHLVVVMKSQMDVNCMDFLPTFPLCYTTEPFFSKLNA